MVPQQQIFLGRQCYLLARQVDLHPSHCVSLSLSLFLFESVFQPRIIPYICPAGAEPLDRH